MGFARVFRFHGSTWIEETNLFASDGYPWGFSEFGYSVAISGERAVIGSPGWPDGIYAGAVYIYGSSANFELDCNGNGIPDECDIIDQTSTDINNNGIPDECEVDCNGNSIPDDWDIYKGNSVDCNANGVPDECDIASGTSSDIGSNGIPDECEPDCNGNNIPDYWDIKTGTSGDCNENGIPDECDITVTVGVITQNPACDINENTMVVCGSTGTTSETWFARNFYIDHDVTINSISWGSDVVANISAEFYFSTASGPGNPEYLTLVQVGSAVQPIDGGPWYTTPVNPFNVAGGSYLVVEVRFPETDEAYVIPAGTSTATAPTYVKAADCGIPTYVDLDIDIGYPEAQIVMCLPLNEEGGGSSDCNGNGIPDECEADCNGNGIPDECEEDCNGNGIPDECETFADCNENGIPDECEIGNDCNGNTIPDECEKLPDCNENGTPDECETFPDCNENGIPDECDISSGLEEDCNGNGVPDSCDVYFDDYVQRNVIFPQEMHEGYFGATVSISGNTAIVGSRLDPNLWGDNGWQDPVTIYRFNGTHWIIEATLTSEDPYFGMSVAIDGEIAVVGSLFVGESESGLAYVYRYNGSFWVEEAVIDAYDEETSDYPHYFGASISIYNDTIVIGAPEAEIEDDDGAYHNIGAAYVYHYDGSEWIKEAVLSNPEAVDSWGYFGWSVSIDDGTVAIGDPWADDGRGAAYVFKFLNGEWSGVTQLLASDGEGGDEFGFSVSVSGDNVIVGAYRKSSAEYYEDGAAYIYTYADSEWGNETKLVPQANLWDEYDHELWFGFSVSIDSNVCVVGQPANYAYDSSSVYIYRFEEGIWSEPELIASSDTDDVWYEYGFGWSVSLDGPYLMIGSPFEYDWDTPSEGRVFFFQENEGDCNANGIPDECEIADGSVQDYNENGIPDDCECLADVTGDGTVAVDDLLSLIAVWGTNNPIGDINYDNEVNVDDLLVLMAAWGDCP